MKKNILFALAALGVVLAYALPEIGGTIGLAGTSLATLPAWFVMNGETKTFKSLSAEEVEKLEDADYTAYKDAEKDYFEATIKSLKENGAFKSYWVNTSGNELAKKQIIHATSDLKSKFKRLIHVNQSGKW